MENLNLDITNVGNANKNAHGITFIAIQGATCSGKSTFTVHLLKELSKYKRTKVISIDDYYKSNVQDSHSTEFVYDNPAAMDWEGLEVTLRDYMDGKKMINVQKKEFGRPEIKYFSIPNIYPEVIIMEGIYAFHKFNKMVFDIEKFDPYKPTHMHKNYPLVENASVVAKCNCIKIFLEVDRESARVIRIHRDMFRRRFGDDVTVDKENLEKMFQQNVWPSTDKWINKGKEACDYLVEGGSFNTEQCDKTIKLVLSQFGIVTTSKDYSNEPKFVNPRVTYMKIIKK